MSARISPRDGSAGLYTEGVQAPQAGLQRPSVRAMRERAVASFFIFCAFLFFTRPGRFFNLAPELLLFADNLDGAFFLPDVFFRLPAKSTLTALALLSAPPCCPPKARPTNNCPPRLGALLPYFLLRGVYTLPHGGPGGSTQRGRGKSEPMLISRPDH